MTFGKNTKNKHDAKRNAKQNWVQVGCAKFLEPGRHSGFKEFISQEHASRREYNNDDARARALNYRMLTIQSVLSINNNVTITVVLVASARTAMFRFSSAITSRFQDNAPSSEIEKSNSTPTLTGSDDRISEFSDTVSEPDHDTEVHASDLARSPFKFKKGSKSSKKRQKAMPASFPSPADTPETPSGGRSPTIAESLERPVALSPRLR